MARSYFLAERICLHLACPALALCLAACNSLMLPAGNQDAATLLIRGLVIENRTQAFVSSARLLIPASGQFVSCGNIAPGANCATSFPEQRYSGNPVEVRWSQAGHEWSTGELQLEPKENTAKVGQGQVRVVIAGPNSAVVELMQSP